MAISNFQTGIASYGIPLLGGGGLYPVHPQSGTDVFFVDDTADSSGYAGTTLDRPFQTIQAGVNAAVDGRNTIIYVAPGEYNEAVNVNKRNIAIIGSSGRHTGITRITGPGSGSTATINVADGFLRGFVLANVHLDTAPASGTTQALPVIRLVTEDTGTLGATSDDYHFLLYNVEAVGDELATGLLLEGASMGKIINCTWAGMLAGIRFAGPGSNNPSDIHIVGNTFYNNVTADLATTTASLSSVNIAPVPLTSVVVRDSYFLDVGGTAVTNYVNFSTGSMVNVGFYNCYFGRDIADDTLFAAAGSVAVAGCYTPAGLESFTTS